MEQAAQIAYRFGGFLLDPARRLLFDSDRQIIPLKSKAFDTLLYLVEHRGTLVGRRALLDAVWPHAVVETNNLDQAVSTLRRVFGEKRDDHRFIVTEPARGYRFVAPVEAVELVSDFSDAALTSSLDVAREVSIAVLPFVSINGSRDDYLSDGLTDDLISRLGRAPDLKVSGLTSSRFFKDKKELPGAIAEMLGVRYLLEGSVRVSGDRLRVNVRLLDTKADRALWQELFDRQRTDLITIQDQIAANVVERLEVVLRGRARARFARRATDNPEAQHSYFLAKSLAQSSELGRMNKAIEHFRRATELDPGYAAAFVGWADTVLRRAQPAEISPLEAATEARDLLRQALDADPDSAEAHAILAFMDHDVGDCRAARMELAAAELADPSNVDVMIHLSRHHIICDWDPDKVLDYARRAAILDPMNPWAALHVTLAHYHRFEYADALREVDRLSERFPDYWIASWSRWWILDDLERYEDALDEIRRTTQHNDFNETRTCLAIAHARLGRFDEARAIYAELMKRDQYWAPSFRALLLVALGEREAALEAIEEAYDGRDRHLRSMLHFKGLRPLHGEARFERIVEEINHRPHMEALGQALGR